MDVLYPWPLVIHIGKILVIFHVLPVKALPQDKSKMFLLTLYTFAYQI